MELRSSIAHGPATRQELDEGLTIAEKHIGAAAKPVADISHRLADAMEDGEEAERKESIKHARAIVFASANAPRKVNVPTAVKAVLEISFFKTEEIPIVYNRLLQDLQLGEKLADRPHRVRALDRAHTNYNDAHKLFITAKREVENWERDNEVLFATLRSEANRLLQEEKDAKRRNKTITDADVAAKMAEVFPDEMRAQEAERRDYQLMLKGLEHLVAVYMARTRGLERLVGGE